MRLSFVIPAYNEELELPVTIKAIQEAADATAHSYEIIVVDDGSTDGTGRIARATGANLISIQRRHIAAARNTGGQAARGDVLFFVDADTRINAKHITGALVALETGYSGGSARAAMDGEIPLWGRIFLKVFSTLYFANGLGAGAFLFTTRENFYAAGCFDEQYFAGEEVFFSLALRKLGRFIILREPIVTSGRKLRMYSATHILTRLFAILIRGPRATRTRERLDLWYNGERESGAT